ncbi:hypothetical protein SDC9_212413 [bioreactor metagenome]|uniref:Uncharacterized protein n=1 Tax=bioreactor metagenome TaxID=1076179 RepID=A0A645JMR8_9ZZZZ
MSHDRYERRGSNTESDHVGKRVHLEAMHAGGVEYPGGETVQSIEYHCKKYHVCAYCEDFFKTFRALKGPYFVVDLKGV